MRVSKADVITALERYRRNWEGMGFSLELTYQEGSPSSGIAHRVFVEGGSAAPGTGDRGYIGFSRSEAYETLNAISRTLEDLSYLRKLEAEKKTNVVYFETEDGGTIGFEV